MKVVLIYRKQRSGGYSIEQLFRSVASELNRHVEVIQYETRGFCKLLSDVYHLRKMKADIYHVTGDIHYMAALLPPARTILTVHDLGHLLKTLSGLKRWLYKWLWLILPIRAAASITAISCATRQEIRQHLAVDRDVTVIPNCFHPNFKAAPFERTAASSRILQIGTGPNKNLPRIIEAVKGLDCRLVIVGQLDETTRLKLSEADIDYESHCDLGLNEIVEQYVLADLVTFVSLYEGFGLPIIEAQVIGRPVITSREAPMCDVAADSACLVDPLDIGAIRNAITQVLKDETYRKMLIERGYRNAARFSPAIVAPQYMALYRETFSRSRVGPHKAAMTISSNGTPLGRTGRAAPVRRVHWICWHPTPYLDHLFDSVSKSQHIDLLVHYMKPVLATHPWKTAFAKTYRSRTCRLWFGIDWNLLSLARRDTGAYFLVSSWNHPCPWVLLTILRLLRRAYGIWTDTPNLGRQRTPLKAWARALWLRWIFSQSTHILGTGKSGVQALEQMGAPLTRLVNFPFYIDLSVYKPATEAVKHGESRPLRFMSIGRVENRLKGHDLAIRAFATSASQAAIPYQYWIAGTGPDEMSLQQLAKTLGLEDNVKFLGWVEPEELRSLLLHADVLIHPSPVHDPFPNAILEAMAAGLVVLGSDSSGSAVDRIEHGLNGFIHRAGDIQELSSHLRYVFQHAKHMSQIGKRARATAELWPMARAVTTVEEMVYQVA